MSHVGEVSLWAIAMLPKTICDRWAGPGWGRLNREPLPTVITDPHIGEVAFRTTAVVPDRPGLGRGAILRCWPAGRPGDGWGLIRDKGRGRADRAENRTPVKKGCLR